MKLEICTASVNDCITAEKGGADRVELNSALMVGGLTPSYGIICEAVKSVTIPVIVMIRPRDGGFCYTKTEFKTMQDDIDSALGAGAAGVAFGILMENRTIDTERSRILIEQTGETEAVLHRAYDLTPDPFAALDTCIELGFNRILTSGQGKTALEGAALINDLINRAHRKIEILPGSGITSANIESLIDLTGCTQVHCSLTTLDTDQSGLSSKNIDFRSYTTLPLEGYKITDLTRVQGMAEMLSAITGSVDSERE